MTHQMMKGVASVGVIAALAPEASSSLAKVIVDPMFTDNMVLQRGTDVPVWGKAEPGENVTVSFFPPQVGDTPSQTVTAHADENGKWLLTLKPLPANRESARLVVSGDKAGSPATELKNVLVGEVWLGSGQSNMAYGTRHHTEADPDLKAACVGGPYPMLRIYVDKSWQIADTNI